MFLTLPDRATIFMKFLALTIPTEVAVASQNPTNILDLFGGGKQKASERANRVPRALRVAI
jgi:hypothetical protein